MFREVAGEIVVAYDHRVPADTLGPVRTVADRLFRVEVAWPLERSVRWLYRAVLPTLDLPHRR